MRSLFLGNYCELLCFSATKLSFQDLICVGNLVIIQLLYFTYAIYREPKWVFAGYTRSWCVIVRHNELTKLSGRPMRPRIWRYAFALY